MNDDQYESALDRVAAELRAKGILARCSGKGSARVLYAMRGNRAVEISGLADGAELPVAGTLESAADRFDTLEAAAAEALAWLSEASR